MPSVLGTPAPMLSGCYSKPYTRVEIMHAAHEIVRHGFSSLDSAQVRSGCNHFRLHVCSLSWPAFEKTCTRQGITQETNVKPNQLRGSYEELCQSLKSERLHTVHLQPTACFFRCAVLLLSVFRVARRDNFSQAQATRSARLAWLVPPAKVRLCVRRLFYEAQAAT